MAVDEEPLVDAPVHLGVVGVARARGGLPEAEGGGGGRDVRPQRPEHMGRCVLALARVDRLTRAALSLGLQMPPQRA